VTFEPILWPSRSAAAATLGGNVTTLLGELGGMRAAFHDGNIDACIEHDINFHRNILNASQTFSYASGTAWPLICACAR